jgi:2-polyprenyl-3-methyl-5-hydroxy-6-metoxy-1,4-benzoquinol methylase
VVKAGGSAARSGLDGLLSGYLKKKRLEQVLPFIAPGARVLDVGCDDGALLEQLPACRSYVGLDSSAARIDLDRRQFRRDNVEFIHADLDGFSWPGPLFDVVVLAAVLEHLDGLAPALSRLRPWVVAGGRLVATTPAPLAHTILRAGAALRLFARDSLDEHKNYFRRGDFIGLPGWELETYRRFEFGLNQLLVLRKLPGQGTGP